MLSNNLFLLAVFYVFGVEAFVSPANKNGHELGGHAFYPSRVDSQPASLPPGFFSLVNHHQRNNRALGMMKNMNNDKDKDDDSMGYLATITKDKPLMWVVLPFMLLVGVDIALNVAVLVKRTFDYFVLGQAPSTEAWW